MLGFHVKGILLAVSAYLLAGTAPVPGAGQNITGQWELWESFAGRGFNGIPMCGISTEPTADKTVARSLAIKMFSKADDLTIDIYKQSWDFPKATNLEIALKFNTGAEVTLPAYGDGNIIDVRVPAPSVADFLLSLSENNFLRISFPKSREADWMVGLMGAKPAVQELTKCAQSFVDVSESRPTSEAPDAERGGAGSAARVPQKKIPAYDVEQWCDSVARSGGARSEVIYGGCIDQEQSAYDTLKSSWDSLPNDTQLWCDEVARSGSNGSYVILRGCVEQETSAKQKNSRRGFRP